MYPLLLFIIVLTYCSSIILLPVLQSPRVASFVNIGSDLSALIYNLMPNINLHLLMLRVYYNLFTLHSSNLTTLFALSYKPNSVFHHLPNNNEWMPKPFITLQSNFSHHQIKQQCMMSEIYWNYEFLIAYARPLCFTYLIFRTIYCI